MSENENENEVIEVVPYKGNEQFIGKQVFKLNVRGFACSVIADNIDDAKSILKKRDNIPSISMVKEDREKIPDLTDDEIEFIGATEPNIDCFLPLPVIMYMPGKFQKKSDGDSNV
jgi:hypothetical protein